MSAYNTLFQKSYVLGNRSWVEKILVFFVHQFLFNSHREILIQIVSQLTERAIATPKGTVKKLYISRDNALNEHHGLIFCE